MQPQFSTKRERGQAIVLVALMAIALVAFVGLALDGAQVYQQRRRMQNAADAGAYVGAREISLGTTNHNVYASKISSYTVGSNGIGNGASLYAATFDPSGRDVKTQDPLSTDNCVRVSTRITYSTFLIGLIGFDTLDSAASAKACSGPIASYGGPIWPMLVASQTINYGQQIQLLNSDSITQSGGIGWADFPNSNGNGAGDIQTWISINTPYNGNYRMYDWSGTACQDTYTDSPVAILGKCLAGQPGVKSPTQVQRELDQEKGITVTVLFYDSAACASGNCSGAGARYHIVSLGEFVFLDADMKANPRWVTGKFIQFVLPGQICVSGCVSFGVSAVALTN